MKYLIMSVFVVLAVAAGVSDKDDTDKKNSPMSLCEVLRMCDPDNDRR